MELIERYLQAVGFWLPKRQKNDIINELSEDIRSQVEEREVAAGRSLNQFEIAGLLKERGRPVVVAGRYLPQQTLIGPVFFPIYNLVLKIVLLCYLIPRLLAWIGLILFDAHYSAERLSGGILREWTSFWGGLIFVFGMITAVFAVLERVQLRSDFLNDWSPLKLPAVVKLKHKKTSPRVQAFWELVTNSTAIAIWLSLPHYSHMILGDLTRVFRLSPEWQRYYWPILGLMFISLLQQITTFFRPDWRWLRPAVQLGVNVMGLLIIETLSKTHPYVLLLNPASNQARYGDACLALNQLIFVSLLATAIGLLIAGGVHAVQLVLHFKRTLDDPDHLTRSTIS
jgi:hypothetical protein